MQELGATIFKATISISFRIKKKTYRFVIIYKQEISVVFLERMVAHCISFCYHMENCCQVVAIVLREILQNSCLRASIFHLSQKLLFECALRKNGDRRHERWGCLPQVPNTLFLNMLKYASALWRGIIQILPTVAFRKYLCQKCHYQRQKKKIEQFEICLRIS